MHLELPPLGAVPPFRLKTYCAELGLRHLRTRPYRPQTNGKAERFIQTMLREWAYVVAYDSSMRRARALGSWLAERQDRVDSFNEALGSLVDLWTKPAAEEAS